MKALAKIAERHPGLKLHIDHLGRLGGGRAGTDDAAFADLLDILALAKFPNVAVKMSGAPSHSSQPYPFRNSYGCLCQRSEEDTSELQSLAYLVCRHLLEKKKEKTCAIILSK